MLSSSWETEQKTHNMVNWSDPKNNWQRPEVRAEIAQFQDTQIEAEFAAAVEQHRVEEIYWVEANHSCTNSIGDTCSA
jgi:hypothetical protein